MDNFVGEIRAFAFGFNPVGWLPCDGRTVALTDYQPLFAVIGGLFPLNSDKKSFNLPNLNSQVVMGPPQDPRQGALAQMVGTEGVTITSSELPAHTHTLRCGSGYASADETAAPAADGTSWLTQRASYVEPTTKKYDNIGQYAVGTSVNATASSSQLASFGAPNPAAHENRQPCLAIFFCIATNGVWPSRPD
jgi:microcystin-dependent protein